MQIWDPIPGISYAVSSVDIEVGGVTYTDPSDQFGVILAEENIGSPIYLPELVDLSSGTAFVPAYTGVTNPSYSGSSPVPTGFTGYSGSVVFNEIQFDTTAGLLSVDYLPGLDTSITDTSAVPEGSSFAYLAIGIFVFGLGTVFGRKTLKAGFSTNPL